jgi:hypothetical protein
MWRDGCDFGRMVVAVEGWVWLLEDDCGCGEMVVAAKG